MLISKILLAVDNLHNRCMDINFGLKLNVNKNDENWNDKVIVNNNNSKV